MLKINSKEDRDFLENIVMLVNNVPKYNFVNMANEDFIKYLKRKFIKNKLDLIYQYMIIRKSPEELVKIIKDIGGFAIAKEYVKKFNNKRFFISFEKKIGKRYCDIIIYDQLRDKLIAFEIKSNGDKLDDANSQLMDYSMWAEEVYLIVDNRKKYEKILEKGTKLNFGIIVYNQKQNKFKMIRKSGVKKKSFLDIKELIPKNQLKNLNEKNWKEVLCK